MMTQHPGDSRHRTLDDPAQDSQCSSCFFHLLSPRLDIFHTIIFYRLTQDKIGVNKRMPLITALEQFVRH